MNVATGPKGPMSKTEESDEDKLLADQSAGGMFTNVDPSVRRIVPDAKGRTVVKVVYVVLESQYQSALSAAVNSLNANNPKVCFEVSGYLLEELRDAKNLAMMKEDVENANIFIGSLIFIEELAEKIVEVVQPLREKLDACLIFPSMPAVMRLNKLGTFSMAQLGQSKSAIASFMKKKKESGGFEEGMLKLVRTLPKVLKYLPSDKAQDARNFMNSLQYWLGGSSDNLENFLLMISKAYVPALKDMEMEIAEPETFPDIGIWHPTAPTMYEDLKEYLNWYDTRKDMTFAKDAPVVGLVLQRSHLVTGDEGHYAGMVMELESRGAKVVPVFAGGLDFSVPVERFFFDPITKGAFVDTVLSLTGFALVAVPLPGPPQGYRLPQEAQRALHGDRAPVLPDHRRVDRFHPRPSPRAGCAPGCASRARRRPRAHHLLRPRLQDWQVALPPGSRLTDRRARHEVGQPPQEEERG